MRGEVTVRVQCLTPERLIDRAVSLGARFEAIRFCGPRAMSVQCDAPSSRILLTLCERFGIPGHVTAVGGGSALRRFVHRRRTLFVGLALCVALCFSFLSRIWIIDVAWSGDVDVPGAPAAIREALRGMDIRPGIPRHNLDAALLSDRLRAEADGYSYIEARVQGVRLSVEAAPEVPAPVVYDVDAARDLVAAREGIVVSAVARSGELCVHPGDIVRRGQLLIRGEELSGSDGETRSIAALGEVVLRSWYEGSARLPLSSTREAPTGRASISTWLTVPGFTFPIARGEVFSSESIRTEYLAIGGMFLPIEVRREVHEETRRTAERADVEALKKTLSALALADAVASLRREGPDHYTAMRTWTDYEIEGGALRARSVVEIQADAAVTREAITQGG